MYLSVVLRPQATMAEAGPAVQLMAGVAVAETLAELLPHPLTLWWPNDCFAGQAKIAGVLVEGEATGGRLDFLVCGVGINVNHLLEDFPPELRGRATSLRLVLGHPVGRQELLVRLLELLEEWEEIWRGRGLGPVRERWLELSPASRGEAVEVHTDAGLVRGEAAGLSASGGLLVEVGEGRVQEITVGEVVRLRRDPAAASGKGDR